MQTNKLLKLVSLILTLGGTLLFLVGLLFKFLHWPDMFHGIYVGPIYLIIGLTILAYAKFKN